MTDLERKQHHLDAVLRYQAAHPDRVMACRAAHKDETRVRSHKAYVANPEKRKAQMRVWETAHPESLLRRAEKYRNAYPERCDEARARFALAHPDRIKAISGKKCAKRRVLGFVPMNQPFIGCEGHHLNQSDVIYIPKALHRSIAHNVWTGRNMEQMNALASNWMTEDWT